MDLLRYLVKAEQDGMYREPFSVARPRPNGKMVLEAFYRYRFEHFQEGMPGDYEAAGRKLIGDLCEALNKYYGANPDPRTKGTLRIDIKRVRGGGYEPTYRPIGKSPKELQSNNVPTKLSTGRNKKQIDAEISKAFEEFFGEGASTHDHNGSIVLRSDPIDEVLKDFVPDLNERIKALPTHRLHKARTWINTWDTEGARAIRAAFQKHGKKPPELVLTDHRSPEALHFAAPFEIVMGLFTAKSRKATQTCDQWLRIDVWPDAGDAVSFHEKLGPEEEEEVTEFKPKPENGFRRLLPLKWDKENYLDSWLNMLSDANVKDVHDYAIIFRHTILKPELHRQVIFVVAGFTERSTAIAGRYFAKNWLGLWRRYVRARAKTNSLGDFLIVIKGVSRPECFIDWSEDEAFEVTPERLYETGIKCEWYDRIRNAAKDLESKSGSL